MQRVRGSTAAGLHSCWSVGLHLLSIDVLFPVIQTHCCVLILVTYVRWLRSIAISSVIWPRAPSVILTKSNRCNVKFTKRLPGVYNVSLAYFITLTRLWFYTDRLKFNSTQSIFITVTARLQLQLHYGYLQSLELRRLVTDLIGLRENAGHENEGQVQHNTTHRQFTRKLEFNDRQERRNSNNILITNLPMIQSAKTLKCQYKTAQL